MTIESHKIELALKWLGSGFLNENLEMRTHLVSNEVSLTDWFNELLRLIYCLIFLMVAEDRDLLHDDKAGTDERRLYREGCSLSLLRNLAVSHSNWDRHYNRFEDLKSLFRSLAEGDKRLGLNAFGGLFRDKQLPILSSARLNNKALLACIFHLGWLQIEESTVPVDWCKMKTEELGSIYETLLELQPQLSTNGRNLQFASNNIQAQGSQRKITGSYYTPDSLVQVLLDTVLDPILNQRENESEDPVRSLLDLSVMDPACGSGRFLVSAARRIAKRVAHHRAADMPLESDYRQALRDVARQCLYGVDRNPMAVELTKVALWIETVEPGRPLGYFDMQIRCGDALLGLWNLKSLEEGIPDDAYKALTGDVNTAALFLRNKNRNQKAGQAGQPTTGVADGLRVG